VSSADRYYAPALGRGRRRDWKTALADPKPSTDRLSSGLRVMEQAMLLERHHDYDLAKAAFLRGREQRANRPVGDQLRRLSGTGAAAEPKPIALYKQNPERDDANPPLPLDAGARRGRRAAAARACRSPTRGPKSARPRRRLFASVSPCWAWPSAIGACLDPDSDEAWMLAARCRCGDWQCPSAGRPTSSARRASDFVEARAHLISTYDGDMRMRIMRGVASGPGNGQGRPGRRQGPENAGRRATHQ